MESQQKPRATPVIVLKIIGLSLSMILGLGAAFYSGFSGLSYVLAPCVALEMSCFTGLSLVSRYLRGRLFDGQDPNTNLKGSFWLGCVLLCLSVIGCFIFAITGFAKMEGFEYKEYGLYASLAPCLLSVVCSCVLIYDARHYLEMWQREVGNAMAGTQMAFQP